MVGYENGPQLAQTERPRAAAQRRAMQEDAQARRGAVGRRGIGGHGAEDALEDGRPLKLERQARGCQCAAQHWSHSGSLQAGEGMEHVLGHLRADGRVSRRRFPLELSRTSRPPHADLPVSEVRS